ncbi:hypothetical protein O3M35_003290 [Rhynocoris fuscipes]|uniref:Uncharacterized protein n=1 Tax=Rhynocoris fuscipes TaxID=488301 RepID=A0AAW1CQC1_9HEMI
MDDTEFFQKIEKSYGNETYDIKNIGDLVNDVEQQKIKVLARIKDLQDKTGKAEEEIFTIENEIKVAERLNEDHILYINDLEMKSKEKQLEIRNFNELKKSYLLRRDNVRAKLSKKDCLFMASIQNRYKAFKCLTGVRWFYPRCSENYVEGAIINLATHKTKFFNGRPDPDELWRRIEEISS